MALSNCKRLVDLEGTRLFDKELTIYSGFQGGTNGRKVKVYVAQSCPTLCDPMDYGLPVSSVHWILQARTLEWVAIPFSR